MNERVTKIDQVPRGSKLERYLKLKYKDKTMDEIFSLWGGIFDECLEFASLRLKPSLHPGLRLNFVRGIKHYEELEKELDNMVIVEERAKNPSTAFVVHNKFGPVIYVCVERLLELPNVASLIVNLVETYFHEILHAFGKRDEQEVYDTAISLIEGFLGITLSSDAKNLKASDYYEKKNQYQSGAGEHAARVQSMKEEVRIWKLPGWLLKHFREAQGFSSPRKTVLYSVLVFSVVAFLMLVLNTLGSSFGLMIVTVWSLTFFGTLLVVTTVMHFFGIIVVRKECYACQFGFYIIAHELNHVRLNALNDKEELVDREAQKQVGDKFFPLLLSNPVLCKNCAFRKKKYQVAAEEYAKAKKLDRKAQPNTEYTR